MLTPNRQSHCPAGDSDFGSAPPLCAHVPVRSEVPLQCCCTDFSPVRADDRARSLRLYRRYSDDGTTGSGDTLSNPAHQRPTARRFGSVTGPAPAVPAKGRSQQRGPPMTPEASRFHPDTLSDRTQPAPAFRSGQAADCVHNPSAIPLEVRRHNPGHLAHFPAVFASVAAGHCSPTIPSGFGLARRYLPRVQRRTPPPIRGSPLIPPEHSP